MQRAAGRVNLYTVGGGIRMRTLPQLNRAHGAECPQDKGGFLYETLCFSIDSGTWFTH
jgi:hypothetical protein